MRLEGEKDIEQLRGKAMLLRTENERLSNKVVELLRENLSLKGMSQEQLQATLSLLDDELNKVKEDATTRAPSSERRGAAETKGEKKPQTGHGPTQQPKLPVVDEVHALDEADQQCPECGGQLVLWAGADDVSEEVEIIERRFFIKRHLRQKFRCKCGCIEMAGLEPRLIPGGRYSNDFAIEVAADKYITHIPLEREVRKMAGEGLEVTSQTLWDQVHALAKALTPAWEALRANIVAQAVAAFDETRWEVLTEGSAARKSWTMWQLSTWQAVYFTIAPDGDAVAGKVALAGFSGIALGDAASVHKSMAKAGDFRMAFCWSHARRKFIKSENSEPIRSKQFIEMVAELYVIEAQAPPGPLGDATRKALRDEQSRPIVARIKKWLLEQRFLPGSDFGKAVNYVVRNWDGLVVFLDAPAVPIDNNRTERGFRGPALGRNNFYGSKSKRGTEVAAILYSLVETAKLVGVDPKRYLKVALAAALRGERIPLPFELSPEV